MSILKHQCGGVMVQCPLRSISVVVWWYSVHFEASVWWCDGTVSIEKHQCGGVVVQCPLRSISVVVWWYSVH